MPGAVDEGDVVNGKVKVIASKGFVRPIAPSTLIGKDIEEITLDGALWK